MLNQKLTASKDELQTAITDVRTKMAALLQQAADTADSTNSKMGSAGHRKPGNP